VQFMDKNVLVNNVHIDGDNETYTNFKIYTSILAN